MVLVISGQYQEKCTSCPKQEELIILLKHVIIMNTMTSSMAI